MVGWRRRLGQTTDPSSLTHSLLVILHLSLWVRVYQAQGSDIPHVDECNYCQKCIVDAAPSPVPARTAGLASRQLQQQERLHQPDSGGQGTARHLSGLAHAEPTHRVQGAGVIAVQPGGSAGTTGAAAATASAPHSGPAPWTQWPSALPRIMTPDQLGPPGQLGELISPEGRVVKAGLKNCTMCRGCTAELEDIGNKIVQVGPRLKFTHGSGSSSGWIFFATPAGTHQRYILKVFCIPFSKSARPGKRPPPCAKAVFEERLRLLIAQQALYQECGAEELTPKVWIAPVSAILPGSGGYHVRWYGLWMEEARGITLHGLHMSRSDKLVQEILVHKLNQTQVIQAAVLDVLTTQCDRHTENVFVTREGQLQVIDNDKALGVVPNCGVDSMFIPGTRYHSILRVGFWSGLGKWYVRNSQKPNFCRGPVDPRIVVEYRCGAAGVAGTPPDRPPATPLSTNYPPALKACLSRLATLSEAQMREQYGLTTPLAVGVLRNRSQDLSTHGFEWTLANGYPLNQGRFKVQPQPPCCGLAVERNMLTCSICWQPILNNTNVSRPGAGIM